MGLFYRISRLIWKIIENHAQDQTQILVITSISQDRQQRHRDIAKDPSQDELVQIRQKRTITV